ncbi:MAG: D-alanyl-D-alanine carboxypeptidase [Gammaproteobacteria bacterium]|nr:D-alanyl-D-alanine carboxypeptidase [Gammaproteobacteria bacterium]
MRLPPLFRPWLAAAALIAAVSIGRAEPAAETPPPPPDVAAKAWYLADFRTGTVLAQSGADAPLPPASLTKLMTAYIVFDAIAAGRLSLDERVRVSRKAWRMRGSRMFIEVDTEVAVGDLLRGLIIQSGNDAAVALAEHLAGSEDAFVESMNERAAALGMTGTTFRNTTGLPARGHVSTARDLARLASAIIAEHPQFHSLYAEREFTYNNIRQYNRNRLLWRDAAVDGMKTGYTKSAGYCLVGTALRGDMRLIAVVLGADTPGARTRGSKALLDYGFEHYETHRLYAKGQPLTVARVWKGAPAAAPLGLAADLYVTIPRGGYESLTAVMDLERRLFAPLEAELEVGDVSVAFRGEKLSAAPLVVLKSVSPGGLWTRLKHELLLWWEQP